MSILFSLLTNPVTISVLVLCVLCLTGLNVLLSMLIACIIGGVAGGIPAVTPARRTQAGAHRCADARCLPIAEPHSGAYRVYPDSRAAAARHDEPYAA